MSLSIGRKTIMRAVFWISIFSFIWLTGFPEPCPADVSTPDAPSETNGTFQEVITKIPSEPSETEEPVGMLPDPLEPLNRVFFHFNDKFYFWLLKPVATGYKTVVPQDARVGVRNFFSNLTTPIRLVNCMLQVNFKGAGNETFRFFLNSTFGVLGFLDIAKKELSIEKSEEDFGQTLGFWGIGPVIYIDWPILGPSSLRDTVGFVGDLFLDFRTYVFKSPIFYVVRPYEFVNDASLRIGEYEDLKEAAIDPYTALKDAYHQYRQNKIRQR